MSQQEQQLVPSSTAELQRTRGFDDAECPDCFAPLVAYYEDNNTRRYFCENCGCPLSAREAECDWDDYPSKDDYDNDISILLTK